MWFAKTYSSSKSIVENIPSLPEYSIVITGIYASEPECFVIITGIFESLQEYYSGKCGHYRKTLSSLPEKSFVDIVLAYLTKICIEKNIISILNFRVS